MKGILRLPSVAQDDRLFAKQPVKLKFEDLLLHTDDLHSGGGFRKAAYLI